MINFKDFVKTYDVRGLVGSQLTEDVIAAFGAAFVDELELAGKQLVIGHDMRDSSPEFASAFAEGAAKRGGNPLMLGLCSTDMTYFASGKLDLPSVMFTASHNPASYNGMKFSRAGAKGIGLDSGLGAIRDRAQQYFDSSIDELPIIGVIEEINLTRDYVEYLRKLVDLSNTRRLKIVVDAANGMGGFTVPLVLEDAAGLPALNLEIVPLYFELDGTFPNHEANPLQVENLRDLQQAVVEHGADLGLAFDGDADRCFAVDEKGGLVSPSALAAIVSIREIERVKALGESNITVLHNLLTSKVVEERIKLAGATPVRTKVGHSLIKEEMAATNAVFGGEHSAHYYFRDFWGADNGMLAALHLISELGDYQGSMSELSKSFSPYFSSGEINSTVADVPAAIERLKAQFSDCVVEQFDGYTFSSQDKENWFWFNVRSSNTEPLLRLNVESNHEASMEKIRDQAITAIRNG
ncbi:MAG: phosphomannomutase/phosphoglucomutase [Actinomycetota bacterium]|nr:phosphomannomutase/phosphoglucomutase [Actinomycetota bacterium]